MATVLIAENKPRISDLLVKGLLKAGYAAQVETEGSNILTLSLSGTIDLILLNLMMSDVNGICVLHQMQEHAVQTPVIVLTEREEIQRDEVLGLGAKELIRHPFLFKELFTHIRRYI
ncbi:response regulator with CheY-like receiver domain and winged-helix DNA-binding domain [Leptolyngbya sp. PCC 7375]|nr:response regulator with CheY-like receiver domain and winged-helix DNA-binding domain [Leptolyngbya sp. PCC 7375]